MKWAIFGVLCIASIARGQTCAPGWEEGFGNSPLFNGEVRAAALFDSGSGPELYVAGHFTAIGGAEISGVARWNGESWESLGSGLSPVDAIFGGGYWLGVLDDGTGPALYVGGQFDTAGGVAAPCVARWDGVSWSAVGAGFDNTVRMMTMFDDGSGPAIHAAGLFRTSGTNLVYGIAKWSGTEWEGVGGGLTIAPTSYGWGYSARVFDLGNGPRLYVGGKFTHAGGVAAGNFAVWDGRSWSAMGQPFLGSDVLIIGMEMFDHGQGPQLHVGGRFSMTGVQQRARVMRWDGAQWVQLGSDLSGNSSHYVNSFAVLPGPSGPVLHIGGWFDGAAWLGHVNYTARWEGGDWRTLGGGMSDPVRAMFVHDDGSGPGIYTVGAFTIAGGAVASRVARWDGDQWHPLSPSHGLSAAAYAVRAFDDGHGMRVFAAGDFVGAGGRVVNGIAAWDGAEWHALRGPAGPPGVALSGGTPAVFALEPFDDGSGPALYVAGQFNSAGGGPVLRVARWDGTFWSSLGGNGVNAEARALAVHDDGSGPALYVGGAFTQAAGVAALRVARWNGSTWGAAGGGFPGWTGPVYALAHADVGQGPSLYAAGIAAGSNTPIGAFVFRLNGGAWEALAGLGPSTGAPASDGVWTLSTFDHGTGPRLYAGGAFGLPTGTVRRHVASWDGSAWTAVAPAGAYAPTGTVYALSSRHVGWRPMLAAAGAFGAMGPGGATNGLVQWDGSEWSGFTTGVSIGRTAAGDGSGGLFVGGTFSAAGGVPSGNFARWESCACYGDCTTDGQLSPGDFTCFQTRFMAADPAADCNADGALSIADFGCFQRSFAAGCP